MTPDTNAPKRGAPKDKRPYITVTNELFRHPKWLRLSEKARLYLLELWGHCNEFRTDGQVEDYILNAKGPKIGRELIAVGWVESTPQDGIYYMHDYLDHQPSKAEIEDRIEKKSAAGGLGAHRQWHVKKGRKDPNCTHCQADQAPQSRG